MNNSLGTLLDVVEPSCVQITAGTATELGLDRTGKNHLLTEDGRKTVLNSCVLSDE